MLTEERRREGIERAVLGNLACAATAETHLKVESHFYFQEVVDEDDSADFIAHYCF